MSEAKNQLQQILKNSVDCVSQEELLKKISKSISSKKPLIIKAGFDPTYPDLHLGHVVLLKKLKTFQDLGHKVTFLIGDFTAQIGDPSGQNETRPPLTEATIKKNMKTYSEQVYKILDRKKTKILYNSKWLKKISPLDWIKMCSTTTIARMIERDDFSQRFKSQKPIYIHEFLYPLIQGYDSYAMKADIEVGGTDQLFNLIMGREIQRFHNENTQCVLTFPLLEGTDGVKKMSKSLNNFIALNDTPKDMYGKIMSVSDELLVKYYELLTDYDDFDSLKKQISNDPYIYKKKLAYQIVKDFHSQLAAEKSRENFESVFSQRALPTDIPEVKIQAQSDVWICHLMKQNNLIPSTGEGRRLILGGGVQLDSKKISDPDLKLELKSGQSFLLQVGKRKFLTIKVK